jgi:hypothetical protein
LWRVIRFGGKPKVSKQLHSASHPETGQGIRIAVAPTLRAAAAAAGGPGDGGMNMPTANPKLRARDPRAAKIRPGLIISDPGLETHGIVLLVQERRTINESVLYLSGDGAINRQAISEIIPPDEGTWLDILADGIAEMLRKKGLMSLEPARNLATDGAHNLVTMMEELDAIGWRFQSLQKTKAVAVNGHLCEIEDEISVEHVTKAIDTAVDRASTAALDAASAVEDAMAVLPKSATVHALDELAMIVNNIGEAGDRLKGLKLDSVAANPYAPDTIGDCDPYYLLMRSITEGASKAEARAGCWWGKGDGDDDDVADMLAKLNTTMRDAETLLMRLSLRYVQTKSQRRKAGGK